MDVYSIPLYYISFQPDENVENHYKVLGFKNVNHFSAVPGRKMDIKKLRDEGIISIRSYDDLLSGRSDSSGMSSLGAIGCTLSHYELWKLCIDKNLPFITIAEEDNRMEGKLAQKDLKFIQKVLAKPNSVFVSSAIKKQNHRNHFS